MYINEILLQLQKNMWNVNDKGYYVDTKRIVVRVYDVATRGAGARTKAGGTKTDAMMVRRRAAAHRARLRVTTACRRRRCAAGSGAAAQARAPRLVAAAYRRTAGRVLLPYMLSKKNLVPH